MVVAEAPPREVGNHLHLVQLAVLRFHALQVACQHLVDALQRAGVAEGVHAHHGADFGGGLAVSTREEEVYRGQQVSALEILNYLAGRRLRPFTGAWAVLFKRRPLPARTSQLAGDLAAHLEVGYLLAALIYHELQLLVQIIVD